MTTPATYVVYRIAMAAAAITLLALLGLGVVGRGPCAGLAQLVELARELYLEWSVARGDVFD